MGWCFGNFFTRTESDAKGNISNSFLGKNNLGRKSIFTHYNAIDRYHIMLGCILGAKDNIGILISRFFNKKNHGSKSKS